MTKNVLYYDKFLKFLKVESPSANNDCNTKIICKIKSKLKSSIKLFLVTWYSFKTNNI